MPRCATVRRLGLIVLSLLWAGHLEPRTSVPPRQGLQFRIGCACVGASARGRAAKHQHGSVAPRTSFLRDYGGACHGAGYLAWTAVEWRGVRRAYLALPTLPIIPLFRGSHSLHRHATRRQPGPVTAVSARTSRPRGHVQPRKRPQSNTAADAGRGVTGRFGRVAGFHGSIDHRNASHIRSAPE